MTVNSLVRLLPSLIIALYASNLEASTLHVNPESPQARDSGDGAASRPYRTLSYALKKLSAGGHLLIAPGVYRESIDLRQAQLKAAQNSSPTVIDADPGTKVLIKGSEIVTDWESLPDGLFVRRNWPVNSQQVFVDGVSLKQIGGTILNGYPEVDNHPMKKLHQSNGGIWPGRVPGGVEAMTENSFHYAAESRSLYVKSGGGSLRGKTVEASVRAHLMIGQGVNNIEFRNLSFAHANTTSVNYSGAIKLNGNRLTLDHIEVTWTDGAGLDLKGDDNIVEHSTANYCGQVGMKVRGRNARLIDNETSYNNTRGFNKWWEAGGAKFVGEGGLQDSEVSGHRAFFNRGDGIWFDWKNNNNRIHDSVSAYNSGMGLHYEASTGAKIYDNYLFANTQRGVYLPNSSNSLILHNLIAKNGLEGIVIVNERKEQAKTQSALLPKDNHVIGNIVAWNGKAALILPDASLPNASDDNLFVSADKPPSFSLGWGRGHVARTGLSAWHTISGRDHRSRQSILSVPSKLQSGLDKKQTKLDWSILLELASEFKAPSADSSAAAAVHLENENPPGPRR